jgi:hypothetical protein
MKTLKEIKQLYSYQFKGKNLGFGIANGWLPEFSELCKNIDDLLGEDKRGFHWIQLKEKFGSARYYWSIKGRKDSIRVDLISTKKVVSYETSPPASKNPSQALFDQISELIDAAEAKTRSHCIVCGADGKIDQHEGYVLVLCDLHAKLQANGGDLDIWPKTDDE